MTVRATPPFRADHVGSFLRPPQLLEARLASRGLRPWVALEIDAIGAIIELVAEGQGFAVLSPRAVNAVDPARELVARSIVQPALKSALTIAVAAQRPTTPLQTASVELITELVPAALGPSRFGPATATSQSRAAARA